MRVFLIAQPPYRSRFPIAILDLCVVKVFRFSNPLKQVRALIV